MLRELHTNRDGAPDLAGRSYAYRQLVSGIYKDAGVTGYSERDRIQSALRYHVGKLLREKYPPDQIVEAGLSPELPRERIERHRKRPPAASKVAARELRELRNDLHLLTRMIEQALKESKQH